MHLGYIRYGTFMVTSSGNTVHYQEFNIKNQEIILSSVKKQLEKPSSSSLFCAEQSSIWVTTSLERVGVHGGSQFFVSGSIGTDLKIHFADNQQAMDVYDIFYSPYVAYEAAGAAVTSSRSYGETSTGGILYILNLAGNKQVEYPSTYMYKFDLEFTSSAVCANLDASENLTVISAAKDELSETLEMFRISTSPSAQTKTLL